MNLEPLLARLATHEEQVVADAERLREQIAELSARLGEVEQELEHLRITRKTILALPDEDTPQPPVPEPPARPEHEVLAKESGEAAGRRVTSFLVNIRSTQDRQLPPEPLTNRCCFT